MRITGAATAAAPTIFRAPGSLDDFGGIYQGPVDIEQDRAAAQHHTDPSGALGLLSLQC
jgi:hypothetical protein